LTRKDEFIFNKAQKLRWKNNDFMATSQDCVGVGKRIYTSNKSTFSATKNKIMFSPTQGNQRNHLISTTILSFLMFCLLTWNGYSQTQFWSDNFEDTGAPSSGSRTPSLEFACGGPPSTAYFKRTNLAGIDLFNQGAYTNIQGSKFWAGEDIDKGGGACVNNSISANQQVTWSGINIAGKGNLSFKGLFAASPSGGWQGKWWATNQGGGQQDFLAFEYRIDNGSWVRAIGFYSPLAESNSGGSTFISLDTDGDLIGDGAALGWAFTEYEVDIVGTGTTLDIRMNCFANASAAQELAVDNFRLFESPSCVSPVITSNPPNRTICNGGNTTLNITATGATAFQWQVNTGSGFSDISNGGVYSGATTNTLTITNATNTMNGYQYRCVAINGVSSCFTNTNSSTLTVTNLSTFISSQTNIACNGGTTGQATASANGGTAPYAYLWSNGQTTASNINLAAGTYTVTVTDANACTKTTSATITQPTALNAFLSSQTNIACNGGSTGQATASANGGTAPYAYLWSNGRTTASNINLAAGTYTVTVTDANACTKTSSATITQPTALNAFLSSQTNIACNGGSTGQATASANGGTAPYAYLWSNGRTTASNINLAAGTYTVTVTDANACTKTTSATITQPTALNAFISSQTNIACNGASTGQATAFANGGTAPYAYLWSNGQTTASSINIAAGTYTVTVTDANACTKTTSATITQPTALSVGIIGQGNVSCNGGSNGLLSATGSGGSSPYSYQWSNGLTTATSSGLAAGTYTVTITDANACTKTSSGTITQPSSISGTISKTDATCAAPTSGSATINATGGTSPYTYQWSNGRTTVTNSGIASGTYTVTVTDANTCTAVFSTTLNQAGGLTASISSSNNVSCNGGTNGSAIVTPNNGTAPFAYLWSNGRTTATNAGIAAGTYTVTVTDATTCSAVASTTITQPSALNASISSQTNVACNGGSTGSATVSPTGGTAPYSYQWSNGRTTASNAGIAAGTYTVTVTDANACTNTQSATITQPTELQASISASTNVSCNGGTNGSATVSPTGGTSPYAYQWSNGRTTATNAGIAAGTYTVTVTDANACVKTSSATITQPTELLTPISTQTNVSCNGGTNGSATVSPTGGTPSYSFIWSNGRTTASNAGIAAGTYTVTVTDANACTKTQSVTITQPSALIASISSQTNVACNGGTNGAATVSPSGGTAPYTYQWSNGRTTASNAGIASGTYTVTVTDANACTKTQSTTITQPTELQASISGQNNVTCNGGTNGSATVSATGGTTPYAYQWSNGRTTAANVGIAAGTYTVTVTDGNVCIKTQSVTITEPVAFTLNTSISENSGTPNDGSICANEIVTITATGASTYAWSNGATTAAITINPGTTTTYTVTATVGTCSLTDARTISVLSNPTASTSVTETSGTTNNDGEICNGATATITATGGTSYAWSTGETTAAISSSPSSSTTYTVTVTNANGCTATTNRLLTVNALPTPSISVAETSGTTNNDGTICNGASATLTASGGTAYAWSTAATTAAISPSPTTTTTYTVTVVNNNGCSATTTSTVTVTSTPVLAPTVLNVSCNGLSNGRILVDVVGGTAPLTYSWSNGNQQSSNLINVVAGTYSLTVTDNNNCQATTSQTITEPTALVSAANGQSTLACFGDNNGTASVTAAVGGTAPYTYTWTPNTVVGNGTNTASSLSAGTYNCRVADANGCFVDIPFTFNQPNLITGSQSFSVCFGETVTVGTSVYSTSGTYTNTLVAANGCDSILTTVLEVRPQIVSTQTINLCAGESFTVGANTYSSTGVYTDIFAAADGCDSVVTTNLIVSPVYSITQNLTLCFGETATVGTNTYTVSGVYVDELTSINGCDSTITTNLSILPQALSSQSVTVCFGESFSVGNNTYTASGTYTDIFTAASGCDSTVTTTLTVLAENIVNQTVSVCAGGSYTVGNNTYTQSGIYTNFFVTAQGCDSTHTLTLTVQNPVITTTTILADGTITANLGGAQYQWINCSNNQAIAGATAQTFTPTVNGSYAVEITFNGCEGTSECVVIDNVGIEENLLFRFNLYPNPASSQLILESNTTMEIVELLDLSGKVLQLEQPQSALHHFNVENLTRGMYLIRITKNGEVFTKQFVKQ
jgi:hypothetical protein